jgi:hypothetical protein
MPDCSGVQQELSASAKQLELCRSSEELSHLRDTATMMYLEAMQKNYGKAGEYSKEFFDQAQRIVSSTDDPVLRDLLHDILATRDQTTADLAKGDACRSFRNTASRFQARADCKTLIKGALPVARLKLWKLDVPR